MTPKEKAMELINKIDVQVFIPEIGWNIGNEQTKDIALICVNEILDLGIVANEPSSSRVYNYYSKVKIELNKL